MSLFEAPHVTTTPIQIMVVSEKLGECFPPEICRMIIEYADGHDPIREKLHYEIFITARYRDIAITNDILVSHMKRELARARVLNTLAPVHDQASHVIELLNYLYVNIHSKRIEPATFPAYARFKEIAVAKTVEFAKDSSMITFYPREIGMLRELVSEE